MCVNIQCTHPPPHINTTQRSGNRQTGWQAASEGMKLPPQRAISTDDYLLCTKHVFYCDTITRNLFNVAFSSHSLAVSLSLSSFSSTPPLSLSLPLQPFDVDARLTQKHQSIVETKHAQRAYETPNISYIFKHHKNKRFSKVWKMLLLLPLPLVLLLLLLPPMLLLPLMLLTVLTVSCCHGKNKFVEL